MSHLSVSDVPIRPCVRDVNEGLAQQVEKVALCLSPSNKMMLLTKGSYDFVPVKSPKCKNPI